MGTPTEAQGVTTPSHANTQNKHSKHNRTKMRLIVAFTFLVACAIAVSAQDPTEPAETEAPPAGSETADPAPVTDEPAETPEPPATTVPEEPTTTGAAAITVSLLVLVAAIMVTMQWFKL